MRITGTITLLFFLYSAVSLYAADPEALATLENQLQETSGKEKISVLHEISNLYLTEGDPTCLKYSQEAVALAHELGGATLEIDCLLHHANTTSELGGFEEALSIIEELNHRFSSLSATQETELENLMGLCYFMLAQYDDAEKAFLKNLELTKKIGEKADIGGAHRDLATNYRYMGNYEGAIDHLHQASTIFEALKDSSNIFYIKEEMGIVHFLLGAPERALESFKELLVDYKTLKDTGNIAYAHNLVGVAYFELKDYQASIHHHQEAYDIRKKIGDVRGLGETLNNLALPHMALGNWAEASGYLEQSIGVMKEINDYRQLPKILGNIGDAKRKLGKEKEALSYYQQSIDMAESHGGKHTQAKANEKITELYQSLGDFENAYRHQSKYLELRDSLFSEEKTRIIEDMQAKYESKEKEQEIAKLEIEKEQARKERVNLLFGLLAVLTITILIISRQRLKIRNDRVLHEKEKLILKTKEELTAADLRIAQAEISQHKRELSSYMQNVLSKNALVDELEAKLAAMQFQGEADEQQRKIKLNELLELKILTEEDWLIFKNHFEKVYAGFFERLKAQYADLTKAERRLFVLLKLKLSTTEIANILGISPESVKKGRYRLRKKLGLKETENLQEAIEAFG